MPTWGEAVNDASPWVLPPAWEACVEFQAPGSGLLQPQLLKTLEDGESVSLHFK